MKTISNILIELIYDYPNDNDLGKHIRIKKDELNNPCLNLLMDLYPNDYELGFFVRKSIYK